MGNIENDVTFEFTTQDKVNRFIKHKWSGETITIEKVERVLSDTKYLIKKER